MITVTDKMDRIHTCEGARGLLLILRQRAFDLRGEIAARPAIVVCCSYLTALHREPCAHEGPQRPPGHETPVHAEPQQPATVGVDVVSPGGGTTCSSLTCGYSWESRAAQLHVQVVATQASHPRVPPRRKIQHLAAPATAGATSSRSGHANLSDGPVVVVAEDNLRTLDDGHLHGTTRKLTGTLNVLRQVGLADDHNERRCCRHAPP